jgi:hypothetical protein
MDLWSTCAFTCFHGLASADLQRRECGVDLRWLHRSSMSPAVKSGRLLLFAAAWKIRVIRQHGISGNQSRHL